jgi:VanZ family protein
VTTSALRFWGPLLAYMALIFWMSSRQVPAAFAGTPDYLLHGGGYFVFGVLSVRAVARGLASPRSVSVLAAGVAIAVLYGASDEWHQSFVPGRDPSLLDLLADSVGALLAAGTIGALWRFMEATRGK